MQQLQSLLKRFKKRGLPLPWESMLPDSNQLALVTQIVTAYGEANKFPADQLPVLIQGVSKALSSLGDPQPEAKPPLAPMVSAKRSVRPDSITCMACGKILKSMKRHLITEHGMTPAKYRETFGLKSDHPMVAPAYAKRRSELAKAAGLGKKPPVHNPN